MPLTLIPHTIKALDNNIIGGYAVVFGNKYKTDQEGEWFTPQTDFALEWFDNQPVFIEHSLFNENPRKVKIGNIILKRMDNMGLYIEAKLDDTPIAQEVVQRVKEGRLNWSSGSVSHLARWDDTGEIKFWPLVEASVTENPAEIRNTNVILVKTFLEPDAQTALETLMSQREAVAAAKDFVTTPESNEKGRRAMNYLSAQAQLDGIWDEIPMRVKSFFKQLADGETPEEAAKAEGEELLDETKVNGEIEALLQPIAEQIINVAGGNPDEAMAFLSAYIATRLSGAVEVEAEPSAEMETMMAEQDPYMEQPTMLSRFAPPQPPARKSAKSGGYYTMPAVNKGAEYHGLARMVKAKLEGDTAYLSSRNKLAAKSYMGAFKGQSLQPDSAGGFLAPIEQSNEIIRIFHDMSIFMNSSLVRTIPMNTAAMTIPRGGSSVTISWGAEGATLTETDTDFQQEQLVPKKLNAYIPITSELIEDAGPDVDAYLRDEIGLAIGEEFDRVVLRGTGGAQPLGILNRAELVAYTNALNNSPNYASLVDMVSRLMQNKVPASANLAWVVNPRDVASFRKIQDPSGRYIFTGAVDGMGLTTPFLPGRLLDYPVYWTNQLDIDAANNNETEIILAWWEHVLVGLRRAVTFAVSTDYLFGSDQYALRATMRMDVGIGRPQAFQILSEVRAA